MKNHIGNDKRAYGHRTINVYWLARNGLMGSAQRALLCLAKVNSLSPNPQLLIALHSPNGLRETGLHLCLPEKRPERDALLSRAVRSLQSGLLRNYREKWATFAYFCGKDDGISLQSRLRGGGRSLALTFLRPNSLLTGKITGNLRDFDPKNRTTIL
jgi:hypothetical protein